MNIHQIYQKFGIPKNLQEHMLRVAALGRIIADNWTGTEIEKSEIVYALSLHDITKPIMFDMSRQAAYGMPQDQIKQLSEYREFLINKYGLDEHKAAVAFSRDLGVNSVALDILDNIEWDYIPRLIESNDYEALLAIYCDMRIGPNGILNMMDRIKNLKERNNSSNYNYEEFEKNGLLLEQKIMENTKLDLSSITNQNLESLFTTILELEI